MALVPQAVARNVLEPAGKFGMVMVELNSPCELVLEPASCITETAPALIADTVTKAGKSVPDTVATVPGGPVAGVTVIAAPGTAWVVEFVWPVPKMVVLMELKDGMRSGAP